MLLSAINQKADRLNYIACSSDFKKIPGESIAYWLSKSITNVFEISTSLSNFADIGKGLDTGNNDKFLRLWF